MRGSLLLVLLAACNARAPLPTLPSASAASAAPTTAAVSGSDADAGAGDASIDREAEPLKLVAPASVACTLDPTELSIALAFDGTTRPFAYVASAKGKLLFPEAPAARGAFLEHDADGVRVHGFVPRDTLRLYSKKPVALGGFMVPRAGTALRWYEGESKALVVEPIEELHDSRRTTVTYLEQPRASVSCTDLAFAEAKDWNAATFALRGRRGTESHVSLDPIPLSRTPGDRPVAELRFSYPDTAKVLVVERRGDRALVVVDAWEPAALFGWIPTSMLVPPPRRLVGGMYTRAPKIRQGKTDERARRRVVCTSDLPFLAELGVRRAVVGSIAAGRRVTYFAEERADGRHELELDNVRPQENAVLLVAHADVDACKAAP